MNNKPFNFSLNDVKEARFRSGFRGYNQEDVDVFLDRVVEDYAAYNNEIDRLKQEIDELKKGYGYK